MRIARTLIACLATAFLATSAYGQPAGSYGAYPPAGGMPGYGPNPYAGYSAQGYPPQAGGYQQGYGMPMMRPAGFQQPDAQYMPDGSQPYAVQAGPDGQMIEGAMQPPMDGQPQFAEQMNVEPGEGPVMMPQSRPVFTWIPPPTGSRVSAAMGPPYAALRDADGCDPGLFGDWGQIIRSRIGQVYVRAEAIMLRRSNPGGGQALFVTNLQLPIQTTVLTTGNLGFRNEIGQRMTVGLASSERSAFEITYFALQNWTASASATGTANLFLAGDLASTPNAFAQASAVSAYDATMLQSLEFNYIATTIFERFSIIGGFRYFDVKDSLDLASSSPLINGLGGNGNGTFTMHTLNQLYGGQAGVVFKQNLDLLTVELSSKAGVYENYATQTQILSNNGTSLRNGSGSRNTSAFVGDIGLSAVYHFSNFLALRFGYNVMFLDNLALGPNQINFSGTTSNNNISSSGNGLNHDANLFLYGVNAGLDARF